MVNAEFWLKVIDSKIVAVAVGSVLSFVVGWIMARRSDKRSSVETRKQNTFKLNEDYMDQVVDRKMASIILRDALAEHGPQTNRFIESHVERPKYLSIEKVLHFFDNLQDLKEHNLIDIELARGLFSRAYENLYEHFEQMASAEPKRKQGQRLTITQRVCKVREWLVEAEPSR